MESNGNDSNKVHKNVQNQTKSTQDKSNQNKPCFRKRTRKGKHIASAQINLCG